MEIFVLQKEKFVNYYHNLLAIFLKYENIYI